MSEITSKNADKNGDIVVADIIRPGVSPRITSHKTFRVFIMASLHDRANAHSCHFPGLVIHGPQKNIIGKRVVSGIPRGPATLSSESQKI